MPDMNLPMSLKPRRGRKVRTPKERAPAALGWLTSDEEEIARRRWRGKTEIGAIEQLEPQNPFFGSFRVRSASGGSYEVEIRSFEGRTNSCGCADHRVNGLGTCKHIEGVLAQLQRRGKRGVAQARKGGSFRVEIFVDRAGAARPVLLWPKGADDFSAVRALLSPFLAADGSLAGTSPEAIAALLQTIEAAPVEVRAKFRVSHTIAPWLADTQQRAERIARRENFLAEVAAGRQSLDVLRYPLLPYQRQGMLHLAFRERALLADDMGLGKTIQAIAAAELLRRLKGVERVLVVCPASLKGEWQEQIARFSSADTRLITGARAARLVQYAQPGFFTVVNYEQVVIDAADINRVVRPDIVILDEAQRIKNWQTKTARSVKSLASRYAFVLTGTPIENRIDEIYSITQYLEPELLGPLFRFNRDFYELDERGRPTGYKNLDELMRRLQPVILRRRKRDVETELPGRTIKNYFVEMETEQRLRYDEYKRQAASLIQIAKRRQLSPKEFERLQLLLACMRMLCDSPFILDPACRISPKIEELERVLTDLLADPERKVIIFSEWERMLTLVRDMLQDMELEFAWHTGSVPQERRRAEIARFKHDPGCRVFLSTDSGSVGLNLQVASAVINLDLPWNPARLEQRIAGAWRQNQMRSVDVINLVTEDSIEHAMLHVLVQKHKLADGVLDGDGELKAMALPSGRGAFVSRMADLLSDTAPAAPIVTPAPPRGFQEELAERHGAALLLIEAHKGADGRETFVAVLTDAAAAAERQRPADPAGPVVEVLDRSTYETIQRLSAAGVIRTAAEPREEVFRAPGFAAPALDRERIARGAELLGGAERKLRMALLLAQGGFGDEAMPALNECLALAEDARKLMAGQAAADSEAPGKVAAAELPRPMEDIAGAIERMLGDLRQSLGGARLAA